MTGNDVQNGIVRPVHCHQRQPGAMQRHLPVAGKARNIGAPPSITVRITHPDEPENKPPPSRGFFFDTPKEPCDDSVRDTPENMEHPDWDEKPLGAHELETVFYETRGHDACYKGELSKTRAVEALLDFTAKPVANLYPLRFAPSLTCKS